VDCKFRKNKTQKKYLAFPILLVAAFFAVSFSAQATITKEISYQGKLTNASNVAVANGDYAMVIRIYDAASGGSCLWSARGDCGSPTARSVAVANGIFSIMLGETGDNPITLDFNSSYYLGIQVEADAEMTPRKKVGAAGYAFNTDRLDGLDSATANTVSTIVARDGSGNFSAGTITATLTGAASLNVLKSGDTLTGNLDFGANTLTTTNTTVVTNLNADLFDGLHSSAFQTALTNPVTGTGVINYLSKFTGTSAVSDSVIYDDGTNVGIGTTSPGFKVDVNGIINSTGLYVNGSPYIGSQWTTASPDIYYATGNVSIGTTSPLSKLTVMGATTQMSLAYDASNYASFTVDALSNLTITPSIVSGTTTIGAGDESMRIDANGNIGIGTASPFSMLTVLGATTQMSLAYDASNYANFAIGNTGNLTIAPNNATAMTSIGAGSAVALKVDALGNIGIGTTTPGYKLDVVGDVNISGSYRINGTVLEAGVGGTGAANYLPVFVTATTLGNSMLYQSGSNIGIGTVGPMDKLHLYNTANSANNIMLQGTDSSGVNATEQFIAAGDWGNTYLATHNSGRTATRFGLTLGGYGEVGTDAGNGFIVGTRNASPLIFGTNATEYMRISATGNIGIGTTGPAQKFQVNDTATTAFVVTSVGQVGIGTTGPAAKLDVTGGDIQITTAQNKLVFDSQYRYIQGTRSGADYLTIAQNSYAPGIQLGFTAGTFTPTMTLTTPGGGVNAAGNVGIGTTAPGAKLDVTGNVYLTGSTGNNYIDFKPSGAQKAIVGMAGPIKGTASQDLALFAETGQAISFMSGGSGTDAMTIASTGNVGIGTTSPRAKLDVTYAVGSNEPSFIVDNGTYGVYVAAQNTMNFNYSHNADSAGYINYWGYAGGTTQYRDLNIANGKGAIIAFFDGSAGTANKPGGGSWGDSSDQRLKTQVVTYGGALEKLMQLRGVTFNWINPAEHGGIISQGGFIAQEVERIFPSWVKEGDATGRDATLVGTGEHIKTLTLPFEFNAVVVEAIKEQQTQLTSLRGQLSGTNLQLSTLTSEFNLLQDNYLALDALSDLTVKKTTVLEKNINTLGAGTNFLRDRMEKIATQNFVTTDNRVAQTVSFENFSTENQAEISSNLIETKLADQTFVGKYQTAGSYGEIKVDLGEKKDFSASDTEAGYLTFEIYLENAEGLNDFNTELGNVMDQNELQWNRANHPYFTTGWNTVRLALGEGIKNGEVDWSALNYFRVYFNSTQTQEIKIRNINLELKSKYVPLAQTIDAKDLDLFNNTDQGVALKDIFGELDSIKTQELASLQVNTKLTNDLKIMRDQVALLQEQTKAVIDLSLAMSLDNVLYRDAEGSVLGLNIIEAEKVEAQEVETKKVEAENYVVSENSDPAKNNVGSVIVRIGQQEVLVENSGVTIDSKIIVTPVGSSPVAWVISDKINNQGFKIKLDKPAEFDIAFDYWVIGVER
jgi:hypothetical protein